MESLTNKLTDIVAKEVQQFELFLRLLTEQQDYLIENDLDNINQVVKAQEEAILSLRELEKSRTRIVNEISGQMESGSENLTLSRIVESLPEPQAEKLEKMQKTLLDLHKKVSKAKSRNEFLIRKSMEYIDGTFRLLSSNGVSLPTYAEKNSKDKPPASVIVNRTV